MFAAVAAVIAAAILLIGTAIGLTMPTWEALFNKIIIPMAIFIRDTVLMVIDNLTSNLVKLTNEALIPLRVNQCARQRVKKPYQRKKGSGK